MKRLAGMGSIGVILRWFSAFVVWLNIVNMSLLSTGVWAKPSHATKLQECKCRFDVTLTFPGLVSLADRESMSSTAVIVLDKPQKSFHSHHW
jgi:hypothetical protein